VTGAQQRHQYRGVCCGGRKISGPAAGLDRVRVNRSETHAPGPQKRRGTGTAPPLTAAVPGVKEESRHGDRSKRESLTPPGHIRG